MGEGQKNTVLHPGPSSLPKVAFPILVRVGTKRGII